MYNVSYYDVSITVVSYTVHFQRYMIATLHDTLVIDTIYMHYAIVSITNVSYSVRFSTLYDTICYLITLVRVQL